MKKITYQQHYNKWVRARNMVATHNEELIAEWQSIPWWKFWVKTPSFEEQRQIVLDNWSEFNKLPRPRLSDYFPIKI